MSNVLVIGGSGFVGGELVHQLLDRSDRVCVFDKVALGNQDIEFLTGDFTNVENLHDKLHGRQFDVMYHIASLPGDTGNPREMIQVNVLGLHNTLEWARANPVKHFVLTSSISAYEWYPATKFNPPDYMPVDEEHPCRPKDMYSTTKRMQELLALTYYHQYQVPVSVARLTAVVGPGGKGGGRGWRQFAEMIQQGKKVQIPHFSPQELCHYVDIRDVGRMHYVLAEHPAAVGEIFNCCAAKPTRGDEFIAVMKKLLPHIEVECGFAWSMAQGGEIAFDMSKAKKLLNFEPKYNIEDSITNIIRWINSGGLEKDKPGEKHYGKGIRQ